MHFNIPFPHCTLTLRNIPVLIIFQIKIMHML
jgi:hypothetical protein